MKKYLVIPSLLLLFSSCNNAANIDKTDICGKEFTETIQDPMYNDVSTTETTIFNCDGTFTSDATGDISDPSSSHPVNFKNPHFTGKWELIKDIPDNVKQAVIQYGLKQDDHNYSIIKYSSSNGVGGYCLYNLTNSTGTINPLYTGQVSQHDWGNISGAAGIFAGMSK